MALFVPEIEQLKRESPSFKEGRLPPLLSFLVGLGTLIVAAGFAIFYAFPFLRVVFEMSVPVAFFLSIGVFFTVHIIIGEIVAFIAERHKSRLINKLENMS
jgi:hypothetical protein